MATAGANYTKHERISKKSLAILGGTPYFATALHVGRPNIGDRKELHLLLDEILERQWFTNHGPLVRQFERQIEDKLDVRHCIAMCNGTIALEIAIRALELRGEVIVPSFTFVALPHALQWQEITPVFCDIDPVTHTLDPACVEKMITPRTSAVIGVHLWGRPCATEQLDSLCGKHGLELMFDASHAFGGSHRGRMIGNFGRAEVFSFHATKFVNCFEGGAVVTNDDELARKMRFMTNFGFRGYDDVGYLGTNGKMHEMSAAMGLVNLAASAEFIETNRRNQLCYAAGLRDLPGLRLMPYAGPEKFNYQYVVVEVEPEDCPLRRDELIAMLHAENVLARRYFWPGCHRMQPYAALFPHAGLLLPNTERVAANVLVLPTGTTVMPEDIEQICSLIGEACHQAPAIRKRMAKHE